MTTWSPWRALADGPAPTWIVLTDDGLEVAGTAHRPGQPLEPHDGRSLRATAIDARWLGALEDASALLPPESEWPEAIRWPFPIALLVTSAGLVTWSYSRRSNVVVAWEDLDALGQIRHLEPLVEPATRRIAAVLIGAGLAASTDEPVAAAAPSPAPAGPLPPLHPSPDLERISRIVAEATATSAPTDLRNELAEGRLDDRLPIFAAACVGASFGNNPFALGMLQSSILSHDSGRLAGHVQLYPIRLEGEEVLHDVDHAGRPGVLLASNYLWTLPGNLEVARRVKERSPDTLVVFGGPSAPGYEGRVQDFLARYPFVDLLVHGEGEMTVAEIVDAWLQGRELGMGAFADIPGLSYRSGDVVVRTPPRDRIADLDSIPSPYLSGLYDHLVGTPMFWAVETNRGCPYGCTFCDWGSATMSRIRTFDIDRVKAELTWIAEHDADTALLTDANFGILARDVEIAGHLADLRRTVGAPRSLIITFAKNTVKHTLEITRILLDAGLATEASLGLQTTDEATLLQVRRKNIRVETYEQLTLDARRHDLPVITDLMLGLPGMTRQGFKRDLQACSEQEVTARVFPTILLENSPMNDPSYLSEHEIVTDEFDQVIATSSFDAAEREEIILLRDGFRFADHFGAIRQLLRFVSHETSVPEIDIFDELFMLVRSQPHRYPVLSFACSHARRYLTPTIGWPRLMAEVRNLVVDRYDLDPDDGLDLVLKVQESVLPSPGRTYPITVELEHDAVTYLRQFLLPDVAAPKRRLCTFPPGTLTVDDLAGWSARGIRQPDPPLLNSAGWTLLLGEGGWNDVNHWELDSPLKRKIRAAYM